MRSALFDRQKPASPNTSEDMALLVDEEESPCFTESHLLPPYSLYLCPCRSVNRFRPAIRLRRERAIGFLASFRTTETSPSLQNYKLLTSREKVKIASEDAFDRGTVGLAALFGGEGQLSNANRSFGQGGAGFGRYFGAA